MLTYIIFMYIPHKTREGNTQGVFDQQYYMNYYCLYVRFSFWCFRFLRDSSFNIYMCIRKHHVARIYIQKWSLHWDYAECEKINIQAHSAGPRFRRTV